MFDETVSQTRIYKEVVEDMVEQVFEGFDATFLAYGQTGSGKTHTGSFSFFFIYTRGAQRNASKHLYLYLRIVFGDDLHIGVAPRVFAQIFDGLIGDGAVVVKDKKGRLVCNVNCFFLVNLSWFLLVFC